VYSSPLYPYLGVRHYLILSGDLILLVGACQDLFSNQSNFESLANTMISNLNSRHQAVLEEIFDNPVRSGILWNDVEALLKALARTNGGGVTEGRGSRVRVLLNGRKAVFHRPHPEKEMDKGAVESLRTFLLNAGIPDPR